MEHQQDTCVSAYPFKTTPRKHQLACWLHTRDEVYSALTLTMGAGKSKVVLDTAAWLYDNDKIDSLVVIAPKPVYRLWGDDQIPAHLPAHVRHMVGVWTAEQRKSDEEALDLMTRPGNPCLRILLMNIEALGRYSPKAPGKPFLFLKQFLMAHRALVVVDESTTIKNPKAARTKAVTALRRLAPYRRILSGQPAVNGPLDMYSQCDFLEPGILGFDSWFTYRAHFCNLVKMRVSDNRENSREATREIITLNKKDPYKNLDELQRIVGKFSFIVGKDALDLPPQVFMKRQVELGPKQKRAYEDMRRMAIVEIERSLDGHTGHTQQPLLMSPEDYVKEMLAGSISQDAPPPEEMPDPSRLSTATLVITQMLRLHQILCGFIVTDDKRAVPFDEPNRRLEDLIDVLGEVEGKAIIWATYKISVREIAARLAKEYGPESVVTYFGETSQDDRRAANRRFQDPLDPARWIVSNSTGARGNTWTQGKTAIYYSYTPDLDIHAQSLDRNHRIGQDSTCTYVYQYAPGTVEEKIQAALQGKADISKIITASNWRSFI